MNSDKLLENFVSRLRDAASANIESVILYGSAASGQFHEGLSDLNVFCVLRDASFASLQAIAPAAKWWGEQKQPPPLLMTHVELKRSADVFTIEWSDMRASHRVLFGPDPLQDLHIPMHLHRIQVEYELREKLLLLRQGFLLSSGDDKKTWGLAVSSVSSFLTLFLHALIALGKTPPATKPEIVKMLTEEVGYPPTSLLRLLELRHSNSVPDDVKSVCAGYLAAIEHVTAAVDKMMDAGVHKA